MRLCLPFQSNQIGLNAAKQKQQQCGSVGVLARSFSASVQEGYTFVDIEARGVLSCCASNLHTETLKFSVSSPLSVIHCHAPTDY
jgi:hypothetical protein